MNINMLQYLVALCFINSVALYGKALDREEFNNQFWFKMEPLAEILKKNPQVRYTKLIDKLDFEYPQFVIAPQFPYKGSFDELFVLSIPDGRVQGACGYFLIDNKFPDEFVRANRYYCLQSLAQISENTIFQIPGKVAVIAQHGAGLFWANYYHAICEVFSRLALLELYHIEYDWLYVPTSEKFMLEALELWGIDPDKIIAPSTESFCIQAKELIVPSLVINTSVGHKHSGNFQHPVTINYVREKLLNGAQKKSVDSSNFSKRVFITRKDSLHNPRKIMNEDEVFALFEQKGFKRYSLCNLSVAEQIQLFHQAEIVVCEQGSGLTNILFCKPGTKVIELFQALVDNCFWWISHVCGLDYMPIATIPIDGNSFANWWDRGTDYLAASYKNVYIPLDEIQKCVEHI